MNSNKFLFLITILLVIVSVSAKNVNAQTILVAPDTLYVGQIPVGSDNVRQIEIFNLSSTTLNISSMVIENDSEDNYTILDNPGSLSLGQLQSVILKIEISPKSDGLKEAELVINSNASSSPDRNYLYGRGLTTSPPTFERIFGDEEANSIASIQQTKEGGYILGGSTVLPGEDLSDFYLVKTDANGKIEWEASHGDGQDETTESITTILEVADGYVAFGDSDSDDGAGKYDFYLVKFSLTGEVMWEKLFGGNKDEKSADMIQASDGGFFLFGLTLSHNSGLDADMYLIKVDNEGNEVWNKNYGGSGGDSGDKLVKTQDGNIALLGSTTSYGAGGFDFWLVKIDNSGNELWNKTYGGSADEEANGLTELTDGSIVMAGYTVSFGAGARDSYMVKTNSGGTELWDKVDGGLYQDGITNLISDDNSIYYTLTTQPELDSVRAYLVKDDLDGTELWRSRFYGGGSDLKQNADGHFLIVGGTTKYGNSSDVYFLNLDKNGAITFVSDFASQNPQNFNLLNNYPNPFNNQTNIGFELKENEFVELSIYNVLGQKIKTLVQKEYSAGYHSIGFNGDGMSSGVYLYKLKTSSGIMVKQMMLLK